ncbi:MAG: hypothetical protein ACLR3C_06740 [Eggerthella lenta]
MKKSLLALATGSFALGFAEFVMMGILPVTASGLYVSVPAAGTFISAYALGVCVGTLFLVFGRRVRPSGCCSGSWRSWRSATPRPPSHRTPRCSWRRASCPACHTARSSAPPPSWRAS